MHKCYILELPIGPRLPQRVDTDNDQVPRSVQVPGDLRTLDTEVNAYEGFNDLVTFALVKLRIRMENLR